MKLEMDKFSYEGKEYEYAYGEDTCKLTVRPYPESTENTIGFGLDGTIKRDNWKRFNYCLTKWDVIGADDRPLPLTEDVKRKVYDFDIKGIKTFVLMKINELEAERRDLSKN